MTKKRSLVTSGAGLVLVLSSSLLHTPDSVAQSPTQEVTLSGPLSYQVIAGSPRRNRKVLGPVAQSIRGVPAEPVDSFVYDGEGSDPIEGQLIMEVDPISDTGIVQASWTDEHGDWVYTQTRFVHPEHPSGVRLGGSQGDIESILNEGLTHNVYLHGDTQAGMPVLPTLFTFIAAWGPADVTLNGEAFVNPYELPSPQWLGHVMVSEGVRQDDGTVRTRSGEIYRPMLDGADGAVEKEDLEVHLVFHDERFPRTGNKPDLFSFFYHLVFEDLVIQIVQAEEPITVNPLLVDPPRPRGREARR